MAAKRKLLCDCGESDPLKYPSRTNEICSRCLEWLDAADGQFFPEECPTIYIRQRRSVLRKKYHMSIQDYILMLEYQGGKCFICQRPGDWNLNVDHDHDCCLGSDTCGKCIRGLLC